MTKRKSQAKKAHFYSSIEIYQVARDLIIEEAKRRTGLETGGILVGYVEKERWALIITDATLPGPKAIHKPAYFLRDTSYCQAELDRMHEQSRGKIHYVGEWHKHLELDPKPSSLDKKSLTEIAVQPNYETDQPVLVICGILALHNNSPFDLKAFLFDTSGAIKLYPNLHLIVDDPTNPIRESDESEQHESTSDCS